VKTFGGLAQGPPDHRSPLRCSICRGGCYILVYNSRYLVRTRKHQSLWGRHSHFLCTVNVIGLAGRHAVTRVERSRIVSTEQTIDSSSMKLYCGRLAKLHHVEHGLKYACSHSCHVLMMTAVVVLNGILHFFGSIHGKNARVSKQAAFCFHCRLFAVQLRRTA